MMTIFTTTLLLLTLLVPLTESICIPRSSFLTALTNVASVASTASLPSSTVDTIVSDVSDLAWRAPNGTLCFTAVTFSMLGHLVSEALQNSTHNTIRTSTDEWRPRFDEDQHDHTLALSPSCLCEQCSEKHESYCIQSRPICCPKLCMTVFKAMSVGALAGISGNGVHACCIDGGKQCKREKRNKVFDFGEEGRKEKKRNNISIETDDAMPSSEEEEPFTDDNSNEEKA